MPSFGKTSRKRRDQGHPDLIKILDCAIRFYDFSIIEVLRSVTRLAKRTVTWDYNSKNIEI